MTISTEANEVASFVASEWPPGRYPSPRAQWLACHNPEIAGAQSELTDWLPVSHACLGV
jgi:hypothetical protein